MTQFEVTTIPASLDAFDAIHFGVRAADPGDARTQDRNQPQSRGPRRALHDALDVGNLVALHVEQEHVRRVGTQVERELLEQRRLHQPDANDEEGAKADGKQDHARLIAGPREAQHRVAQGEHPATAQRAYATYHQGCCSEEHRRNPE